MQNKNVWEIVKLRMLKFSFCNGKMPKNQNFSLLSRLLKAISGKNVFSSQLRILFTEGQSKNRWMKVSSGTGPLLKVLQNVQPAPAPCTKRANL